VHADNAEQLAQVLDDLVREGWLSDVRYAQSLVRRRASTHGAMRIAAELRQSGVADQAVADICVALHETECDRAQAVWQKRFGSVLAAEGLALDRQAFAKQVRFLASRGFGNDVIFRVLGQAPQD
jgi:regulatory protein